MISASKGEGRLRPIAPRKADIQRVVKAMLDLGQTIIGVEHYPDGGFKVLTGPAGEPQRDELEAWRARRDARKASSQGA